MLRGQHPTAAAVVIVIGEEVAMMVKQETTEEKEESVDTAGRPVGRPKSDEAHTAGLSVGRHHEGCAGAQGCKGDNRSHGRPVASKSFEHARQVEPVENVTGEEVTFADLCGDDDTGEEVTSTDLHDEHAATHAARTKPLATHATRTKPLVSTLSCAINCISSTSRMMLGMQEVARIMSQSLTVLMGGLLCPIRRDVCETVVGSTSVWATDCISSTSRMVFGMQEVARTMSQSSTMLMGASLCPVRCGACETVIDRAGGRPVGRAMASDVAAHGSELTVTPGAAQLAVGTGETMCNDTRSPGADVTCPAGRTEPSESQQSHAALCQARQPPAPCKNRQPLAAECESLVTLEAARDGQMSSLTSCESRIGRWPTSGSAAFDTDVMPQPLEAEHKARLPLAADCESQHMLAAPDRAHEGRPPPAAPSVREAGRARHGGAQGVEREHGCPHSGARDLCRWLASEIATDRVVTENLVRATCLGSMQDTIATSKTSSLRGATTVATAGSGLVAILIEVSSAQGTVVASEASCARSAASEQGVAVTGVQDTVEGVQCAAAACETSVSRGIAAVVRASNMRVAVDSETGSAQGITAMREARSVRRVATAAIAEVAGVKANNDVQSADVTLLDKADDETGALRSCNLRKRTRAGASSPHHPRRSTARAGTSPPSEPSCGMTSWTASRATSRSHE